MWMRAVVEVNFRTSGYLRWSHTRRRRRLSILLCAWVDEETSRETKGMKLSLNRIVQLGLSAEPPLSLLATDAECKEIPKEKERNKSHTLPSPYLYDQ